MNKISNSNFKVIKLPLFFILIFTFLTLVSCTSDNKVSDTEESFLVLISELDTEELILKADKIEWIDMSNTERINELGLDEDDFPNGFYIHNDSSDIESFKISENPSISIVNWENLETPEHTNLEGLYERISSYEAPYHIRLINEEIVEIIEQYTP